MEAGRQRAEQSGGIERAHVARLCVAAPITCLRAAKGTEAAVLTERCSVSK